MAGTDLRAFAYPLEAVRRQRQWLLDAALARLSALRRQVDERVTERSRLYRECVAQAQLAARVWANYPNPAAQTGLLGYLAALQQRQIDAERALANLADQVKQAQQACALQQQKLEVLDQHRSEELKAFANQQHRKSGVQADHDWVARESHRKSGSQVP